MGLVLDKDTSSLHHWTSDNSLITSFRYKCPQSSNFTLVNQVYKETSSMGVTATIRKMVTFLTDVLT